MLTTIWRNAQNAWHQVLALAFGAGMLGYFVYGVTEAIALGGRPGFIFWYLLGLVAALHHLATPPLPSQNLTQ